MHSYEVFLEMHCLGVLIGDGNNTHCRWPLSLNVSVLENGEFCIWSLNGLNGDVTLHSGRRHLGRPDKTSHFISNL
jgi:hypothetical protein